MKIEQNTQYYAQRIGVALKPNNDMENNQTNNFEKDLTQKTMSRTIGAAQSAALFYPAKAVKNFATPPNISSKIQSVMEGKPEESVSEVDDDLLVLEQKTLSMERLLKKLGINGEIVESARETVPQCYSMFFVEVEGDSPNIVIIEFENGDLMFTEAECDRCPTEDVLGKALAKYVGIDGRKLSVAELKEFFAKFYNVEELKNLLWVYPSTDKDA